MSNVCLIFYLDQQNLPPYTITPGVAPSGGQLNHFPLSYDTICRVLWQLLNEYLPVLRPLESNFDELLACLKIWRASFLFCSC